MIQEDRVLFLSQLVSTMKENISSLEEALESKDERAIDSARSQIVKVNQEIKENLRKLKD